MARTLSQIDADIDAMRAAMGSPVLRIRYSDREVTYSSQADKQAGLSALLAERAGVAGTVPTRQFRVYTDKGW